VGLLSPAEVSEAFCYLTTTGRRSGRPHRIEIWFAAHGDTMYLMSGGRERADWVRNIQADGGVGMRIGTVEYRGTGRVVEGGTDDDARARQLLLAKYQPPGSDELESWGRSALPVAVDLEGGER
jgi:deazaflavin-dependent oxidoreductase (nitroreductase family)